MYNMTELQLAKISSLPVLAVCGFSGAGKTTLIEAVLPHLIQRGWRVAVIKHDAHGVQLDRPGKDSDRLFRAGADVVLHGPDEFLLRGCKTSNFDLNQILNECRYYYDLILIEGHKDTPLTKVWLQSVGEVGAPADVDHVIASLARDEDRPGRFLAMVDEWLPAQWQKMPVYACILIGGNSQRMGQPKHLLSATEGRSWIEQQMSLLQPMVERVVVAGRGDLPEKLASLDRLSDVPETQGPLAGMLAAMRWRPDVSWLMLACDMPMVSQEAVTWLLAQRCPGQHAVQPRLHNQAPLEPLLACYEPPARVSLEAMLRDSVRSPSRLSMRAPVLSPVVPAELTASWRNINTQEDVDTWLAYQ